MVLVTYQTSSVVSMVNFPLGTVLILLIHMIRQNRKLPLSLFLLQVFVRFSGHIQLMSIVLGEYDGSLFSVKLV